MNSVLISVIPAGNALLAVAGRSVVNSVAGSGSKGYVLKIMTDKKIISVLRKTGPLTGAQLLERTRMEVFPLWQICHTSPEIRCRITGKRFLRLDRAVAGYARLSPSIRREFRTYTVVGLKSQADRLEEISLRLLREIRKISRTKYELARECAAAIVSSLPGRDLIRKKTCFILAGDIVYGMAHGVPRIERSTGKTVRGSDLDIVVIAADDLPEKSVKALDEAIHDRKYFLLVHPDYREEIDYLIKPLSRVRRQLEFDTFESMVAGKILREGEFISGNSALFGTVKELVDQRAIPARLDELQRQALVNRKKAESCLLKLKSGLLESEFHNLFFTREERLEDLD